MNLLFTRWCPCTFLVMLLIACGVNTGNPGGRAQPDDKIPRSQVTMTLSLRSLAEGKVSFRGKKAALIRQNQEATSSDTFIVNLNEGVDLQTGVASLLVKSDTIPPGVYDRLIVTVDPDQGVSYTDKQNNEENLGLAPYQLYEGTVAQDKSSEQRILFDFRENPVTITQGIRQSLVIRSDFASNLRPIAEATPAVKAYFEAQGLSNLRFVVFPDTIAQPIVTELPASGSTENPDELGYNLAGTMRTLDPDLETLEVCMFEGQVSLEQFRENFCVDYYDFGYFDASREQNDGYARFTYEFFLDPGEYTLGVFRQEPVYGLLHFQQVKIEEGVVKRLKEIDLPLTPLIEDQ